MRNLTRLLGVVLFLISQSASSGIFDIDTDKGPKKRPFQFDPNGPERIIAFSDPHGDFDTLVALLRSKNVGIINDQNLWTGGKTNLVVTGDLLDRGAKSRQIMDLLISLEVQAPLAGGAVHVLLGNHEIMNMVGDVNYVRHDEMRQYQISNSDWQSEIKSIEDFMTGDVNPKLGVPFYKRKYLDLGINASTFNSFLYGFLGSLTLGDASELNPSSLKKDFRDIITKELQSKFTPNYVAHRQNFSPDGKYGQWLMQHAGILRLGRTLFMHGGLSEKTSLAPYEDLRERFSSDLTEYMNLVTELVKQGLFHPDMGIAYLQDLIQIIRHPMEAAALSPEARAILTRLDALRSQGLPFSSDGLVWDRSLATAPEQFLGPRVESILDLNDVDRIVIGHTPTPTKKIQSRLGERIWMIDTGMNKNYIKGLPGVLEITARGVKVINTEEEVYYRAPAPLPSIDSGPQTPNGDIVIFEDAYDLRKK